MTLREAASDLRQHTLYDKNVAAIALREIPNEASIVIYVVKYTRGYPSEWHGWPVQVFKSGKFRLNAR